MTMDGDVPCTAPSPEAVIEEQAAELLRLTKPLEEEGLKEAEEWADIQDGFKSGRVIRDLLREIRRLRAGEDTRLLRERVVRVIDNYEHAEQCLATGEWGGSKSHIWRDFEDLQEDRCDCWQSTLRAAIAAEGETLNEIKEIS